MSTIDWTPTMDAYLHQASAAVPPISLAHQARHLGVAKGSIVNRRRHLGITSDRTSTAAAIEARRIDAAERRTALEQRHLDRIEHLLNRLESPEWKTILKGEMGIEEVRNLTFVPPRDEKDIAATILQHWGALERIKRMNPDTGTTEAISMLGGIAKLLEQAAASMPEDGPE